MDDWTGPYKHFTKEEMQCSCGCGGLPKHSFMVKLGRLRRFVGPLIVTSGYRCPEYNATIGGGPAHPAGVAADVATRGRQALLAIVFGYLVGFRGFGVSQKGDQRFIHVDCWEHKTLRPNIWSY